MKKAICFAMLCMLALSLSACASSTADTGAAAATTTHDPVMTGRRKPSMDIIKPDVYLFGQVLGTHSFLLKDGFLQPDEYAEIGAQYFLPAEYFIEPTRFSTCVRESLFGIMFWNSREK